MFSTTGMLHLVSVLALAALALAKPLAVTPRDSVSPPITSPTADTVWTVGETQTVTWDLSALNGVHLSNPSAQIILGTLKNGEENLMLDSPLASGFNITDGKVSLVVPSVTPGQDYIVCLFGDSGDISPAFQIVASSVPASSASSSGAQNIATSSNTLPPHETTDPATSSTSLPSGIVQTSATTTTSTSSLSVSATGTPAPLSSASAPSTSPASSSPSGTSPSSTSSSTSSASASASSAGAAGNFGSRVSVTHAHLLLSGAFALWAFF